MHCAHYVMRAVVLSLVVASCADAQRMAPPPTISDSGGIRIVMNAWPTSVAATIASAPTFEIGGDTDPAGELAGVAGAVRLGDGRLAIAEQSTKSIKLFDARGKFVRAMGRQGAGPGEFSSITRLELLRGDSLAAYDVLQGVLAVFDTSGRLGRTSRVASGMGGLQLQGLLGNGTMVMARNYNPMFSRTSRLERDSITYVATVPGSGTLDTIVTVPGSDVFLFAGADFSSRNALPFGRVSLIGVEDDRLVIATGDRWQTEVRTPTGALREIHRVRHDAVPVTKADIARYKRELLERMRGVRVQPSGGGGGGPDMRAAMVAQRQRMLEAVPYPETHPSYDSLLVGVNGELWVRSAGTPASQPREWVVFARNGAVLGTVAVPSGLRILQVGKDFAVAMRRDDDDVEHVGVYPLRRANSGTR